MELRHLRYFVAVALEENVSRAALKLHLSQPALSRQIRDLEEELGFPLFERSAKSVRLTEAGSIFFKEAQAVLQHADAAVNAARDVAFGGTGELHIGYAPSLTARILPAALRAFQSELPKTRVRLHDLSTQEMLNGLRSGALQLAFVVRPPARMLRELQFEELARESIRLAVSPSHPFARKRVVTVVEAATQPLIAYRREDFPEYQSLLDAAFATVKTRLNIIAEHESVSSLIASVEAGAGVALVSESLTCVSGIRLKLLPLSPAPPPLIVGAAWPKKALSPRAEQFLKHAEVHRNDL